MPAPLTNPHPFEPVRTDKMKMQRIKDIHAAEQKNPKKAYTAEDIPQNFESVTNEFLTAILARDTPGAEVVSFKLGVSGTGTAVRQQFLLEWNDKGKAASLPKSTFCKSTCDLATRLNLCFGGLDSEIAWFNTLRHKVDIETPTSYFANFSPDSYNSIVALADLGGQVDFCGYKTKVSRSMLEDMTRMLAKLHATYWETDEPEVKKLMTYASGFQGYSETCAVDKAATKGWRDAKSVIPPKLYERADDKTWDAILLATDRNQALPHTLTHNDVHIGNWYQVKASGAMGLTDFQTMARGHHSRDLAYMIPCAITPEQRREWEEDILKMYLSELAKNGGPTVSYEDFLFEYRIQLWTALVSWTLTLGTEGEVMPDRESWQPTDICLELIRRISIAIDDHDSYAALDAIKDETPRTKYNM